MRVKLVSATVVATIIMGLAASSASASITIGQSPPTAGSLESCDAAGVGLQLTVASGVDYVVPAGGGVITAWQTSLTGPIGFSVYRGSGTTFTRVAEDNATVAGIPTTFSVRTPVQAGDRIGLRIPGATPGCLSNTNLPGDHIGVAVDAPIGSPTPFAAPSGYRFNVAAVVEPDADGDGFGDETQDQCPGNASAHGACPVPETTITKAPKTVKTNKKQVTVTFAFKSSEADSTFTCAFDGKPPRTCSSPFTVKAGKGKHRFSVVAIDSHGTADPTPATATFKVKHKHKH
jgi:hypothetical protein